MHFILITKRLEKEKELTYCDDHNGLWLYVESPRNELKNSIKTNEKFKLNRVKPSFARIRNPNNKPINK